MVVPSRRRPLTSLIGRVARMAAGQQTCGNKRTSTRNSRSDDRRSREEELTPIMTVGSTRGLTAKAHAEDGRRVDTDL